MSTHIEAKAGQIAEKILLPGDPLRARDIAETFLERPICYNHVRGMLGFTGTYKGEQISVQGTGMGMPSMAIYAAELITEYGAKQLIRVGTCGALQEAITLRDIIIAQGAATSSAMFRSSFSKYDIPAIANFQLLQKAGHLAHEKGVYAHIGTVVSEDTFYSEHPEELVRLGTYGILGVEMETAALYHLAAKYQVQALGILTVSDHMLTEESTSSKERETTFHEMTELALETLLVD